MEKKILNAVANTSVYTVDSYANGISFDHARVNPALDSREQFSLHLDGENEAGRLRSRYAFNVQNPFQELEKNLIRLSKQGNLSRSVIYFGNTSDPFYPFDGKFDASMKFLELFTKYTPGLLVVQTRSPLLVIAMPVLRKLGSHAAVNISLETCDEEIVRKYTPGLPRVEDRLKTANALRHFGVSVGLHVSPLLPYGDWKQDASKFAEILCKHADNVYVRPVHSANDKGERKARNYMVAKALARDRKFHWLRPDSAKPLISAIEKIDAKKLSEPNRSSMLDKQVSIFAA